MYFRIDGSTPVTFTRDEVFLRIEEFEFPAIVVSQLDERGWQANFKWPSWIGASLCAVSVIVMGNASNEVTINQNLENVISVESPSSLREATSLSVFQIEFHRSIRISLEPPHDGEGALSCWIPTANFLICLGRASV